MAEHPDPHEDCWRRQRDLEKRLDNWRWLSASLAFLLLLVCVAFPDIGLRLLIALLTLGIMCYSVSYLTGEVEAPPWLPRWFVRVVFRPVMVVIGLVAVILIMFSGVVRTP